MTAPRGIKSKGRSVWWEEIELWVTRKGMEPFLLPPHKSNECLLVPSVNQNLARQGLIIDRVVWERREFGRPAARLRFFPQHKQCKHSYSMFQKPAGVRLGYVVMQPVITPTCRGADSQAPPMPVTPTSGNRPTGRESGHESGSTSNDTHNSIEGQACGEKSAQTTASPDHDNDTANQSAGSGTESRSEYDSASSSVGEESETSSWSHSEVEQPVPDMNQAATIGITGPNLKSGPVSTPGYESGRPPAETSSYQPSRFDWRACGPPREPQYSKESGLSDVSDPEAWSSEEESFSQNSEAGSGPESGNESGNESGSESGYPPQYINVPRPPWDGGDAGPGHWPHQGGCRGEAPLS